MAGPVAGELVGRVLGGRFRLEKLIGRGASAQVYLATDTRLRRRVAVKILHAGATGDSTFLRRFRSEAQLAARLTHPNLLVIHDWNDGLADPADPTSVAEPPSLVTEFLDGGSLRAILDEGHRLTLSQATLVGLEAARALAYAHRNGVVHRDIKPANLLFGADGRVRIGDFGLARALSEASWTEPLGGAAGTARYAAPEQAMGKQVDGKADVYALVLTLVEAVTGTVPFAADTQFGTAMARLQGPVQIPAELGPLGEALAPGGALDPEDRVDAVELAARLEAAARKLPRPTAVPLAAPIDVDRLVGIGSEPTEHVSGPSATAAVRSEGSTLAPPPGTVDDTVSPLDAEDPTLVVDLTVHTPVPVPSVFDAEQHVDAAPAAPAVDAAGHLGAPVDGTNGVAGAPVDGDVDEVDAGAALLDDEVQTPRPSRRRLRRLLMVLLVVALIGGGAGGLAWWRSRPVFHDLPKVTGQTASKARSGLTDLGFVVKVTKRRDEVVPAGAVIEQTPAPGQRLEEGTPIALVVSDGPNPRFVPALNNLDQAAATAQVEAQQLRIGSVTNEFDETVPEGMVITWSPTGEVPRGSSIDLVLSKGPAPRIVPNLSGMTPEQAKAALPDGLDAVIVKQSSDKVPAGTVIAANFKPGTALPKGSDVKIIVSSGPAMVKVPSVAGLDVRAAVDRLDAAGLTVSGTDGSPDKPVVSTSPSAGTSVKKGSSVRLVTGAVVPASAVAGSSSSSNGATTSTVSTTVKRSTRTSTTLAK